MRSLIRPLLFVVAVGAFLASASVALAAPRLEPGEGWTDGPHKSYPGLCTNCHTFRIWPAPAIADGAAPTHGPRGTTCTSCHKVNSAPVAAIPAPATAASAVSGSQVTLAWTSVTGAVSYRVFRGTSASGPFSQIAAMTGRALTDSGRTGGVRYFYQVKGVDPGGLLGPANTVSVTTYATPTVRVDSSLSQMSVSGAGWKTRYSSKMWGGSTRSSSTRGNRITVPFRGSKVSWYGTRGKGFGKAAVYVDGVYQKKVDLYYSSTRYNKLLFSKSGMADKPHTLTIVVTKSKNRRSTGRRVDVDSFGFTGTAPGLNQEESRAAVSGTWSSLAGAAYSAGAAKASAESTASLTYRFTGTGVTWLGTKGVGAGTAKVYVDGVLRGTADLWAGTTAHRRPVFSVTGLPKAAHKLVIVPDAACNAVATGNSIDVDAFVTR